MAHFSRCHLNMLRELGSHTLHGLLVFHKVEGFFANLVVGHLAIFLQLLAGASTLHPLRKLSINIAVNGLILNRDAVNLSLVKEQFLDGKILWDEAIGVALNTSHLAPHLLHITLEDGLITHHPDYFINDVVHLGKRQHLCSHKKKHKCDDTMLWLIHMRCHQCLFTVFKFC